MRVYGELIRAACELLGADPSAAVDKFAGRLFYNTVDERAKTFDTSGNLREIGVDRSGVQALSSGVGSILITFTNAMHTADYSISWSIKNITDSDPIFIQGIVTAQSASGFTITFNTDTDSANYVLHYQAVRGIA